MEADGNLLGSAQVESVPRVGSSKERIDGGGGCGSTITAAATWHSSRRGSLNASMNMVWLHGIHMHSVGETISHRMQPEQNSDSERSLSAP